MGEGVGGNGNLIPPKPGEIRNPNGRKKGTRNRSTIIREIIEAAAWKTFLKEHKMSLPDDPNVEPKTVADQLGVALVLKAMSGDVSAMKEVMDSAYGKLVEKSEVGHSFNQMGKIEVGSAEEKTALSFDVGSDPSDVTEEDEE